MTREELSAKLEELFGAQKGALKAASKELPINYQNLKNMLSGRRPVPEWLDERFAALLALKEIKSPPSGIGPSLDRDDLCCDALDPHISHLIVRANEAGWEYPEILTALFNRAIEGLYQNTGEPETRQLLLDTIEHLELITKAPI
ncbi:MAG: hypothetical protein ABF562_03045 [Gluconobacter japonicus]|uniref:hypothetical protein n=1 Tax=Gluconobacter japonicus TaxID=376620 RepID=UPI0039E95D11